MVRHFSEGVSAHRMLAREIQYDPSPPFIGLSSSGPGGDSDLAQLGKTKLADQESPQENDMLNPT